MALVTEISCLIFLRKLFKSLLNPFPTTINNNNTAIKLKLNLARNQVINMEIVYLKEFVKDSQYKRISKVGLKASI